MKRIVAPAICCLFLCGCLSFDVNAFAPAEAVLMTWDSAVNVPTIPVYEVPGYEGIYMRWNNTNSTSVVDGAFKFEATADSNRFFIGSTEAITRGTSSPVSHVPGVFDLSQGRYRITVDYYDPKGYPGINSYVRITINNNSGAQAQSILGADSNLGDFIPQTQAVDKKGRITVTVNPALRYANLGKEAKESLKTAFIGIGLVTSGSLTGITITGVRIEKLAEQ